MLMAGGRARAVRRVAMTPLIDIVFILLLFFILETSFSEFRQMGLALPGASTGSEPGARALRLEVFADGRIWAEGSTLEVASLAAFLEQRHSAPDTPVIVALAPAVELQLIVDVCDVLRERRLERVDLRALGSDAP